MNYFFLFNHSDSSLSSSIDIFNRPPSSAIFKEKLYDCYVNAIFSNGKKWNISNIGYLKKNGIFSIKKSDLPKEFVNQSVFIFLSKVKLLEIINLKNDSYFMRSEPEWRANIKISSNFTTASYQGDIPGEFINKNLSLISCSPMIQKRNNFQSFFYLINLTSDPAKISYKVQLIDIKKNVIQEFKCFTNTINFFDLTSISSQLDDILYIFRAEKRGGIPLYFTKDKENKSLSIEHTHPPVEYTFGGNRIFFHKKKKSFWFS